MSLLSFSSLASLREPERELADAGASGVGNAAAAGGPCAAESAGEALRLLLLRLPLPLAEEAATCR